MNRDDLIETIIKEVKRVLAERGVTVAQQEGIASPPPPAPAPTSLPTVPQVAPAAAVPPPIQGATAFVGSRDLTGKQIVTQKDLEALAGSAIRITRRAVVTPLALDYAREKGITLTRVDETAAAAVSAADQPMTVNVALAVSPDFPAGKSIVTTILGRKGFQVRDVSGAAYEAAVKKLTDAVATGSVHFGICIEKTGMEGPIHANRNPEARAVHCRTTIDARAARVDYDANVIVIDSTSDPDAVISGFCGM